MSDENVAMIKHEAPARCVLRLLRGHVLNRAGALHFRRTEMGKPVVVVTPGDRYGRLAVIREVEPHISPGGTRRRRVECKCECGKTAVVDLDATRRGAIVSCGCFKRDLARATKTKHGGFGNPAYFPWRAMLRRCSASSDHNYHNYGGRGIAVCRRWLSFKAFLDDMGPRPSRNHSIDRIDNDGNYEPGNCRWATSPEQHRNRRNNRMITLATETMCITDWAARTGLSTGCIAYRLKQGMAVDHALSLPSKRGQRLTGRL